MTTHLATASNLSKNLPSTIEISSIIKCWQLNQCWRTPVLWANSIHWSSGAFPEPIPNERRECRVTILLASLSKCQELPGPFHSSSQEHSKPGKVLKQKVILLTCKGMERGATNMTSCHSCAGCSIGALWGEWTHNLFQQIWFPSAF